MDRQELYLGRRVDPSTGERLDTPLTMDPDDLTTHAVIVGMTGSGKTGLGVILIEELLLAGTPCLVLDPKGDLGNLLLTFPDLSPAAFEPWINPGDARKAGQSPAEFAADEAQKWRQGLEAWGQGPDRIRRLRDAAEFALYTPGSTTGTPLNIVGSLAAPQLDWDTEAETMRDQIQGLVSGLLRLADLPDDPIASREHILLANLIEEAWRRGQDLTLAELLARVRQPTMRKLGVFDLDTFFPRDDRDKLAMRLNSLVASPTFAAWVAGPPIDVSRLLWAEDGRPRCAVITLSHLSERERHFVAAVVLGQVVTWMRSQPGTANLRALVAIDEVFGFAPPTANPPPKRALLTLLKQGRAHGVGLAVATQNPVDLDYKAMSNAGTWLVGRLQTERDKARLLEGMESVRGDADLGVLDATISSLGKRRFLYHSVHSPEPTVFETRWALSYLRGPLTREQIQRLTPEVTAHAAAGAESTSEPELAPDESPVPPPVAEGVAVAAMDRGAPWADAVGADPSAARYEAALAARVSLRYDDRALAADHLEEWEAIYHPLVDPFDPAAGVAVDHDPRDFVDRLPSEARYALPDAPIDSKAWFRQAERDLKDHLHREASVTVFRNAPLSVYGRVGESREAFEARCRSVADERADAEAAKLRDRLMSRSDRIEKALETARHRREQLEVDLEERRKHELVAGAGSFISAVLRGRGSVRSLATRAARAVSTASSRRSVTARTAQRLEAAEEKSETLLQELEELETELLDEIEALHAKWQAKAEAIDEVRIGLEKSDISVVQLVLCWIPIP